MVTTQANSAAQSQARVDHSWFGVAIVGGVLLLLALAVTGLRLQVAPSAPAPVERFMPLPNGAAAVYRLTEADGTVHYRSRNVRRAPASQSIGALSASAFEALLHDSA